MELPCRGIWYRGGMVDGIVPNTSGEGEVWIMFNIMDIWRAGMKIYRPVEGKGGWDERTPQWNTVA